MNPSTSSSITIRPANELDFEWIKQSVQELALDDRDMHPQQFLLATRHNQRVGYIRIRAFEKFSELCSLGVPIEHRHQGIASQLVKTVIQQTTHPLYLVTIIPEFFQRVGFDVCDEYPEQISQKISYCTSSLPVEEKYLVMRLRVRD